MLCCVVVLCGCLLYVVVRICCAFDACRLNCLDVLRVGYCGLFVACCCLLHVGCCVLLVAVRCRWLLCGGGCVLLVGVVCLSFVGVRKFIVLCCCIMVVVC